MQNIKKWEARVSATVVSVSESTLVVEIRDQGTRRTPPSIAGRMTCTREDTGWSLGPTWTIPIKDIAHRLRWADGSLDNWCRRYGGGLARDAALIRSARRAAAIFVDCQRFRGLVK